MEPTESQVKKWLRKEIYTNGRPISEILRKTGFDPQERVVLSRIYELLDEKIDALQRKFGEQIQKRDDILIAVVEQLKALSDHVIALGNYVQGLLKTVSDLTEPNKKTETLKETPQQQAIVNVENQTEKTEPQPFEKSKLKDFMD